MTVSSGATLSTTESLTVVGGAVVRPVALNIASGTLTTAGATVLNNQAVLNLGAASAGGTINFNGGATLNAGSNLNWSSGTLTSPTARPSASTAARSPEPP